MRLGLAVRVIASPRPHHGKGDGGRIPALELPIRKSYEAGQGRQGRAASSSSASWARAY
jgi:hypothetical protein